MSSRLPDCPLTAMRSFLDSIGWHPCSVPLENSEYWFDKDNFNYVYFPYGKDPIPFVIITLIVQELNKVDNKLNIWSIPFYKERAN